MMEQSEPQHTNFFPKQNIFYKSDKISLIDNSQVCKFCSTGYKKGYQHDFFSDGPVITVLLIFYTKTSYSSGSLAVFIFMYLHKKS